ncbi:hypothetical protein RHMOL_Rhmol07G0003700 [Rhododendron molle]|uniref:Uncharacterized protein n=1 Tax=Rhododendron molle TaxID=49168 RepID=A0ACC0MVK7_RHOML|nr:hypothetical protein RHMOL_Rhmol07G0003700 [Rhododendron molle]
MISYCYILKGVPTISSNQVLQILFIECWYSAACHVSVCFVSSAIKFVCRVSKFSIFILSNLKMTTLSIGLSVAALWWMNCVWIDALKKMYVLFTFLHQCLQSYS